MTKDGTFYNKRKWLPVVRIPGTILKNSYIRNIGVLDPPVFDLDIHDLMFPVINILLQNYLLRSHWNILKHIITKKIKYISKFPC